MRDTPLWRRYLRLVRNRVTEDVDEELAFHFASRLQDLVARGLSEAEAREQLVLRQAAAVVGIGLAVGVAGALALGRALSSLLFETSPSDPRVLVSAAILLTVVALVAAWLPAYRASRVAPRVAIQNE